MVVCDGEMYLCRLKTSSRNPTLQIFALSTNMQGNLELDENGENNRDCVERTVAAYLKINDSSLFLKTDIRNDNKIHLPVATSSPVKSLFDQVLDNASKIAYDAKIGRYIPIDTVTVSDGVTDPSICTKIKYIQTMKREKAEIKRISAMINSPITPKPLLRTDNDKHTQCACCEYTFPASQLLGQITFNAVAQWRSDHGVPICKPDDKRMSFARLHLPVKICVYCNQFFDESFGEVLTENCNIENIIEKEIKQAKKLSHNNIVENSSNNAPFERAVEKLKKKSEICRMNLRIQNVSKDKSSNNVRLIDTSQCGRLLRDKYPKVTVLVLVDLVCIDSIILFYCFDLAGIRAERSQKECNSIKKSLFHSQYCHYDCYYSYW